MRAAALLLIIVLSVAGCGGSDDVADVEGAADAAGDAVASAAEEAQAEGIAGALDAEQCQEVAEALEAVPAAVASAATGTVDAESVQAQADALQDVAGQVPDEISDDFQVVADAYGEIATTLSGVELQAGEVPSPEDQAALQQLSESLSASELQTASTSIGQYFADGCPA